MAATDPDVAYLDLLDPAFRPDGPEVATAGEMNWYAHEPTGLAILRYDKLRELLSDPRLRQGIHRVLSSQGLTEGPVVEWMNSIILTVEGADHTRLRRLVSKAFTPRAVAALRPVMQQLTHELIDQFVSAGRVEFMTHFADPYPARIICELLGVPPMLQERFHGWANDLGLAFSYAARDNVSRIEAALAELYAATDTLIAARRTDARPDLLSALIAAEADGDRLSSAELRLMVSALLFTGQDTTAHQLGHALALFLNHPDQWTLLTDHPQLAEQAVAEVMRIAPATPITGRVATEELEINGLVIPAGTSMSLLLAAGNTDPTVFGPDPTRFDITAVRPAPLTFGAGIHYCLGATLARTEIAEALPILAQRLGPIEPDGEPVWRPALGITGPVSLPIRFTAPADAMR